MAALLELDARHAGQTMFSRPAVLGPLLGLCLGSPWIGFSIGGILELLTLDDLPIGHCVPLNAAVAVAAAVLLGAGEPKLPLSAALPAGLSLGFLFRRVEVAIRTLCGRLARRAEAAEDRGQAPFGRLIATSIGVHAAAVAAFLYAGVAAAGPILAFVLLLLPRNAKAGLDLACQGTPLLGIATLLYIFRPR